MTLTVIGAGYVGLVTSAVFSDLGHDVFCVDVIPEKIEMLKKGQVPFFEPGLSDYIQRNLKAKRLTFTSNYSDSVPQSKIVLICVGTPPKNNGEADLSYLFAAVEETAKNINDYTVISIKSTIPVGFEDDLKKTVKKHTRHEFEFASTPEFLREGTAIEDTLNPDRIVIGTDSKRASNLLLEMHSQIPGKRILCDLRSAQLIKYASNAFLAAKISYANAISTICEKTGADVQKVLEGVAADHRIGPNFLKPGVGYGGSCLPKDVLAFITIGQHFDYDFELLRAVDSINSGQIERFVAKIRLALGGLEHNGKNLTGKNLAILGLAFKPNTDDMREAPSIKIISHLLELGAKVTAYDPQAMENAKRILPQIEYAEKINDCLKEKDALIILTEWSQFAQINLKEAKKLLRQNIIIDGRNIFDKQKVEKEGFKYFGVGR